MRLSLLDVAARPLTFTQRRLMDPGEFGRASGDRGLRLSESDLERLHRARIIVPAYALVRPRWDISRRAAPNADPYETGVRGWFVPKDGASLREDLEARLLRDAWRVPFRPWLAERVPTPHGSIGRREYLYSHHQLADLSLAVSAVPLLKRPPSDLSKWDRDELKVLRRLAAKRRDAVAILEALEPRYLPDIVAKYRFSRSGDDDERDSYLDSFSAGELLGAGGWSPGELYGLACRLIREADQVDPLRGWIDLVRQVHPDRWPRLRGDALQAVELRCAAELVFRFLEDLQAVELAPPFPDVPTRFSHELNERIRRDRSQLDPVLMAFGLSPHPAVVLALEGPSEMLVAPLVMQELGIPQRPSFIRLVDSGGENRDHGFLAQYVTLPSLGRGEGRVASYDRPPTRYIIAVDGDQDFHEAAKREAKRLGIVDLLWRSLPGDFQSQAARDELTDLVLLEVWGDGLDFERAHFTDPELATALKATGLVPAGVSNGDLMAALRDARAARDSLKSVWRSWPKKPTKPDLAIGLWPVLRGRLEAAGRDRGKLDQIPIARVLLRAYNLAVRTPRRHVVFRLERDDREVADAF